MKPRWTLHSKSSGSTNFGAAQAEVAIAVNGLAELRDDLKGAHHEDYGLTEVITALRTANDHSMLKVAERIMQDP